MYRNHDYDEYTWNYYGTGYHGDTLVYTTVHLGLTANVTVKVKYTGSATVPPTGVNLKVDSHFQYTGSPGSGDDYFKATPKVIPGQDPYYESDTTDYHTTRLVHVNLDQTGKGSFSYNVWLNVTGPATPEHYPVGGDYLAQISVDDRTVGISTPGAGNANMRKALTGITKQAYGKNSAGDLVAVGAPYAEAVPLPQLPPSGILDIHREFDYGLPLGKATDSTGPDDSVHRDAPGPVHFTYTPIVTQLDQPVEHYAWAESLRKISASADLPRTITVQYPAWTIENLTADYGQPLLVSAITYNTETNRTYERGDAGSDDLVSLHYAWNDGLTGDASVTTHLHQGPVDNWKFLGEFSEVLPGEKFVDMRFEHGTEANPGTNDNWWSTVGNQYPTSVVLQPAGVNFIQYESAAAWGFAIGEVFAPEATAVYLGFASATLGEATNFSVPPDATTQLWDYTSANGMTFASRDDAIDYWNTVRGRVTPANYKQLKPLTDPSDSYANYVRWHVAGQPRTTTQYYLGDKWGPNGYGGQVITSDVPDSQTKFKGSPLNGGLDYDFDFPSLDATLTGTPGPPIPLPPGTGGGDDPAPSGGGGG